MKAISVQNLWWKYSGAEDFALKDVSFEVEENSFVGIVGPNEAGKTTLVSSIRGLIPRNFSGVWKGEVYVLGEDVAKQSVTELAKRVGFVFADPEAQFTSMSVEEELAFALENVGLKVPEIEERITWAARITMIDHLLDKSPYDISGGQKQRVAIASMLALRPRIIILDEPTSMLDPLGKDEVFEVLARMKRELNMTIVVVEHNLERLAELADRLLLLSGGRVLKYEEPERFFADIRFLEEVGLDVPDGMRVLGRLQEMGIYRGPVRVRFQDVVAALRELAQGVAAGEGGVSPWLKQ